MASSRSRKGADSSRGGRQAKSKKSKVPVAEVEIIEDEGGGLGIDDGIPIITSILLLAAFMMVDYCLGQHYGTGMFFIK
ncbi:MAG: hypothetical protein ABGY71_06725 [bacterium]|jgi:hypothetical protein|nr:hypothetical protein [Planctomycetota bacterium]HIL51967.1 hypothetical protein [Planctomycetota bacterium]